MRTCICSPWTSGDKPLRFHDHQKSRMGYGNPALDCLPDLWGRKATGKMDKTWCAVTAGSAIIVPSIGEQGRM